MAGPFKVLAHAIWIKAEERKPPVTGEALSEKGQTDGWVEFDLGAARKVGSVIIWNLNDAWHTNRGVQKADLSVWTEQAGWRKIREGLSLCEAEGGDDYDNPVVVELDAVEARKVRLDNLANFGDADHIGLSKVQFFEARGPKAVHPVPADGTEGVGPSYATLTVPARYCPGM